MSIQPVSASIPQVVQQNPIKAPQVVPRSDIQEVKGVIADGTKAISDDAYKKQIENLNELLSGMNTNVSLSMDKSGNTLVVITDGETGKVIREMPPKAVVEIAEKARDYIIGLMVDKSV